MFNTALYASALEKVSQKYLLTKIVAMRTRQLDEGAEPLVDSEGMSSMDVALLEITNGFIVVQTPEETNSEEIFG